MRVADSHADSTLWLDDVIDHLLDQPLVETDPLTPRERETPLHLAVHYINTLSTSSWPDANALVHILLDAGCDPRIQSKGLRTPFQIVDPKNQGLRDMLKKAEVTLMAGNDIIDEDEDDDDVGPPSDSD